MNHGEREIVLEGKTPDNVPVYYIHGVWGGINPRGEVVAYLYHEGQRFPDKFQLHVTEEGVLSHEEAVGKLTYERRVLAQLIFHPDLIDALIAWLQEKKSAFEALQTGESDGE